MSLEPNELHNLSSQHAELIALLDRAEALRCGLRMVLSAGFDVAWAAEPVPSRGLILRHTLGDRTGVLAGLPVLRGQGLTGKVHETGQPEAVNNYFCSTAISHAFDWHIAQEGLRRLLAVPLRHENRTFGVLVVGAREPGEFGDRAINEAMRAAEQTALAVAVAECARLAREAAVSEERRRVSAALHDSVGALLYAISASTSRLSEITGTSDPELVACIRRLQQQATDATTALRESLRALRASPAALALGVALSADCDAFTGRTGIPAELIILDEPPPVPPARVEALVTAVREALLNVEKHARASAVVVTVSRPADGLTVAVTDDGAGLKDDYAPGLGLTVTAEALARLGGNLRLHTEWQGGTTWRAFLPC